MKHYAFYEPATGLGRWVSSSTCAPEPVPGLEFVEVDESPGQDFYVKGGKVKIGKLELRKSKEILADEWQKVRAIRKRKLDATEWVVSKAYELEEKIPADWKAYRQALRDITDQKDPFNISWPKEPTT